MIESSSPWKIAGVMDPYPFGHFGLTPTRWQFQHYNAQETTLTDLYLQSDSHHTTAEKYSVVNTLHHRARAVCSNPQLLEKEEEPLQKVLIEKKYPARALNRVQMKINAPSNQDQNKRGTNICANVTSSNKRPYVMVPYVKGLCESLKICMQKTWGTF